MRIKKLDGPADRYRDCFDRLMERKMQERKVAFVMQARLNSLRVPNKMLKPFAGTTLFDIALDKVFESEIPYEDIFFPLGDAELVGRVKAKMVDVFTDDNEEWDNRSFFPTIIHRTTHSCNATNDSNVPDSLKVLYEWYRHLMSLGYTHVVLFNPCHPLVKPETISAFYNDFVLKDTDGLFTVTACKDYFWDSAMVPVTNWFGCKLMNTRKAELWYQAAHVLYGSKLSFIEDECWMGDTSPPSPELFTMDKHEALDIDTLEDFKAVEAIYNARKYEWKHEFEYGLKVIDVTPEDERIMCTLNIEPLGYRDGKPYYSDPQCGETKVMSPFNENIHKHPTVQDRIDWEFQHYVEGTPYYAECKLYSNEWGEYSFEYKGKLTLVDMHYVRVMFTSKKEFEDFLDVNPEIDIHECSFNFKLKAEYFEFEVPLGDKYTRVVNCDTGGIDIRMTDEEE